jgi:hypothetical protein
MQNNAKIEYHPLIAPYTHAFSVMLAGVMGWRLIKLDEFESLLEKRGGNDRVALASRALQESNQNPTFSFRKSVRQLVTGEYDQNRFFSISAQQLIGHCWEILKSNSHVPVYSNPTLEFFRHVRNGCFHGNSFYFLGDEPRNPAQWRGLEITRANGNQRIFRNDLSEKEYFLNWGDALVLLQDVSQLIKERA